MIHYWERLSGFRSIFCTSFFPYGSGLKMMREMLRWKIGDHLTGLAISADLLSHFKQIFRKLRFGRKDFDTDEMVGLIKI